MTKGHDTQFLWSKLTWKLSFKIFLTQNKIMNNLWRCFVLFLCSENSPLASLQYSDGMSFSPGSDPDLYKRMSYSEMSLNKNARISIPPPYPGLNSSSNSKMKSRSHHNLSQLPESPERRMLPFGTQLQSNMTRSQVLVSSHQRASSDTDSIIARQPDGWETRTRNRKCIYSVFWEQTHNPK